MAAWTVLDPAKVSWTTWLRTCLTTPACRPRLNSNLHRGNSSEVHACQSDPRYVVRTVRQQDEVEWQRELSRLKRVPALSVITTIFATSGRRSLMPRLWPVPRGALRTMEVIRLKYDISAALEMLHRAHIVHADVHADNVMLRADLGYGVSGYGGVTHPPPTLESPPELMRTAHGDYYRLARTILKQLYIGPEPSKRKHSDKDSSLPSHLDKELRAWLERDQWPRPLGPTTPFPPGSWQDSAISPSIILHASLWKANGEVKYDTATFASPASKFGNSNGTLVPEGVASEGMQGTGSWEKSAISARFFLKCQLRTPLGAQAIFSTPVQSAIRNAAASLSAAVSFAQDMEQSMPPQTHSTLAQSLRATSDILREVSEELIFAARNDASSAAPGSSAEADDQSMAQDG